MTLLIIDFDHQVYRSAASCEPSKSKPALEDCQFAIARLDTVMNQLLAKYNNPDYEAYIGGEGNWRYDIYPDYKLNRRHTPKPTWFNEVREHAVVKWGAQIVNEREVDDQCGIRLTQENNQGTDAILVSLDKDLKTVSGKHFNWVKDVAEHVSPVQALRYFYGQVITGDQSDHIPSVDGKYRGAVPKFVQAWLDPLQEMTDELDMYTHCKELYEQHDNPNMHRNASVLFIQKEFDQQWQPPGNQND